MNEQNARPEPGGEGSPPPDSLEASTRVLEEQGRYVVMLNVASWVPDGDEFPVTNNWKRINDYATRREAEVAARWIEMSANRTHRPPTGF